MGQQVSVTCAALECRAGKQIAVKTNAPTRAMTFCVVDVRLPIELA